MATETQIRDLERLQGCAIRKGLSPLDVSDITEGLPYGALSPARTRELFTVLREFADAEVCTSCGERLPPPTTADNRATRAQHSLVRYYDDVYGPACGLS